MSPTIWTKFEHETIEGSFIRKIYPANYLPPMGVSQEATSSEDAEKPYQLRFVAGNAVRV
ncbi:hypothetical protein VE02_04906 [Pseudogymnoascus sp. 03VT05]|nr:hypothetical protein VE02_04906 [Pseudogymnoascus sp. 03VT05]